jgi:hypothetical protein
VRFLLRFSLLCMAPMLVLPACTDPILGAFDPLIVTDTITIASPSEARPEVPSALDITSAGGFIRGGRFPERLQDATIGWDFAVRVRDGNVVFVPSPVLGFSGRAGISQPLAGQNFETLAAVPSGIRFETEEAVIAEPGAVYVVRSREFSTGFGGCLQYARLQPLEVDAVAGTVRVRLATNERCYDNRLVPTGG